MCNFVVDKGYRDEADSGFIIKKYLDEDGVKMLEDLEHNPDDDAPDMNSGGFEQYDESQDDKAPREEYKGFMPKGAMDDDGKYSNFPFARNFIWCLIKTLWDNAM